MQNVLQINSRLCYLLYENLLVVNLPFDELEACEEALKQGREYKPLGDGMVFDLNNTFSLVELKAKPGHFLLSCGGAKTVKTFSAANPKALAWLQGQLKERGFKLTDGDKVVKIITWASVLGDIAVIVLASLAHKQLFTGQTFAEIMANMGLPILIVLVVIILATTSSILIIRKKLGGRIIYGRR